MNQYDAVIRGINCLPEGLYQRVRNFAVQKNRHWLVEQCDLYHMLSEKFDKLEAGDFKSTLSIQKGLYDYEYFNICFLNNMLSLIVKAVSAYKLPRIEIVDGKGKNIWEQFFEQPYENIHIPDKAVEISEGDQVIGFPGFEEIDQDERIRLWGNLYRRYVRFNDQTRQYIEQETKDIIKEDRRILGVLCRGTDYTAKKPKGHPVQPELSDILDKAEEKMKELHCQYIYLATEVGDVDRAFRERFPDKILINKREYYDDKFKSGDLTWIKDVHFERENDDYLKGLEYLSSLYILSKCNGIVAGNCGGSQASVFMNHNEYEDRYIFDLGLYQ